MRRKIPSTAALTAFEAAARHQSFTKAADELAVTQSAVCRQIATLEEVLGAKLFQRTRRGVVVTETGQAYARSIRARLDEIERDTLEVIANGAQGTTLELGVVPTFATHWLLPRMEGFKRLHPHITVNLSTRTRPFLFDDTNLDGTLFSGPSGWPGTEAHFLMHEHLVVVASPRLVGQRRNLRPRDVARLPLLHPGTRPHAWREWFETHGVDEANDMAGPRYELFSMISQAAAHGLGVALIPKLLVQDELARGTLVQVVREATLSERSYYFIHPQRRAGNPALQAFGDWITSEARRYREAEQAG